MIEKLLEAKIVSEVEDLDLSNTLVIGAWQPTAAGVVKGIEPDGYDAIVSVKIYPRSYATFTIREAEMSGEIALNVRIEGDSTGSAYLTASDALTDMLAGWQKSFADYADAFAVDGFAPTGFRLDGGDCGFDTSSNVWTWTQKFTLQGIIN